MNNKATRTKTVPTQKKSSRKPATKERRVTLLKRDFDAATRVPWSMKTCLLAQAGKRLGLDWWDMDGNLKLGRAMNRFDKAYRRPTPNLQALKRLRASLPITGKIVLS